MIRIAIDVNVRVRGNLTYSGFEDIDGEPAVAGASVEVYEPESGLAGTGRVVELDVERELVYLEVDWASLRPALPIDYFSHVDYLYVLTPRTASFSTSSATPRGVAEALQQSVVSSGGHLAESIR